MARPRPSGLRLRKHADKSLGERLDKYDEGTGNKILVDPENPGDTCGSCGHTAWVHTPWPFDGMSVVGDLPAVTTVTPAFVEVGKIEGWLETEGDRVVYRPAGPAGDRMRTRHTFVHFDALVLKTRDGDVRFKVTHQPDKYADAEGATDRTTVTDEHYSGGQTRVDHFYRLELEG